VITFKYFIIVFRGMGSSNEATQAPGSTLPWVLTGGDLSDHDVIVPRVDQVGSGLSGIRFSNVTTHKPAVLRYTFDATVVGPDPILFRANNGAIG
jgi:hypothetical protein